MTKLVQLRVVEDQKEVTGAARIVLSYFFSHQLVTSAVESTTERV